MNRPTITNYHFLLNIKSSLKLKRINLDIFVVDMELIECASVQGRLENWSSVLRVGTSITVPLPLPGVCCLALVQIGNVASINGTNRTCTCVQTDLALSFPLGINANVSADLLRGCGVTLPFNLTGLPGQCV